MTLAIAGMSPLKLDTTVFAIDKLGYTPDIVTVAFRHSGNEFPSIGAKPGARPAYRYSTPVGPAYTYFGLKPKISTVAEIYFATFASGLRAGANAHTKLELNTSCKTFSYIDGFSISEFGIAMADIVSVLLSNDGVTFPFKTTAAVSLPALGSEPQLHTFGPYQLGGTRKDGALNVAYKSNMSLHIPINDGDSFARNAAMFGAKPQLAIDHEDALQMLNDLGNMGLNLTGATGIWLAGIDPATQLRQTTGMSWLTSAGEAHTGSFQFDLNKAAKAAVIVEPLSATSTHPITVTAGATLP